MTKGLQSKVIKFLFAALLISLSVLLISCSSNSVDSLGPASDDSASGGGGGGNGGGGQNLASCGFFTQCFEQFTDTDGDFVFDNRMWACYTYDANGNRVSAFVDYFDSANIIQESVTVSYDYDWNNNVLTIASESDTDADRLPNSTELCTWVLDANGNRTEGTIEIDNDADGSIDEQREEKLTYDGHGEISTWDAVVDIKPFGGLPDSKSARTYTRTYDTDGKILVLLIAFNDDGDHDIDAYHRFTYSYDGNGNRSGCDIDYDNDGDSTFDVQGASLYTNNASGEEIEEGERYGGINGSIDFTWRHSWQYREICSTNLSKPLDPLYVLK